MIHFYSSVNLAFKTRKENILWKNNPAQEAACILFVAINGFLGYCVLHGCESFLWLSGSSFWTAIDAQEMGNG
jgi:hypothetical protein